MSKQLIGIGNNANDNTGDTLRVGGDKVNDNFNELYTAIGNGVATQISVANAGTGQVLRYDGTTFVPSDYSALTSALDTSGQIITSSSNVDVDISPNGTGNINLIAGSVTSTFSGTDGSINFPTIIKYKNEWGSIGLAPAAATYPGYFFIVDGDDTPYVNMNITAGGVGDTRVSLLTEYSSIGLLADVDVTTTAPQNNQVLKWNTTSSKWFPADDDAGIGSINLFATVSGDTGSTTANSQSDTLTIAGGTGIATSVDGDTLTIDFNATLTTTFEDLTDTNTTGLAQGNSLFYNGVSWIPTDSPIIWWDLGADQSNHFTFNGPGFSSVAEDPGLYLYRGFTYVFDNSVNGGNHPIRIQSSQGLAGTPYTAGQSGSGSNVLYFTVPMDAPNTLYYQCTIHALMNGVINIVT
jgi:hypothetical protein